MKFKHFSLICIAWASFTAIPAFSAAPSGTLRIEHSPVTLAVQGQDVLFRAQVFPGTLPIKNVTLFYSVSRDAAPYKVTMHDTGSGWFTGSITADMAAGLKQIPYYIEARDKGDSTAETPWSTIVVKNADSPATGAAPKADKGSSWTKPALIAGGVVLAGGAALALASGGGGGGGSSSSSDSSTTNTAGTFGGSVTLCVQPPASSSTCSAHPMTIRIDENNLVSSDTLYEGKHLEGRLSGANFLLLTTVTTTNGTGEIQYLGTVINNRIAGSIQGTLTTDTGTGTYSGNFNAVK